MAKFERRRQFFRSFEAKSLRSRSPFMRIADDLVNYCGTVQFLVLNALLFYVWIVINLDLIPGIPAFDPYPFGFLTMFVSLEAIFLSIFVLISQNRSAYISTIRDEVHMQINLRAEEEVTKILEVLADVRKKVGITKHDEELEKMLEKTDSSYIERMIIAQLERANRPLWKQLTKEFPDVIASPKKEEKKESDIIAA